MHLASAVDQAQAAAGRLDTAAGYAAYSKAQQVWILPQSVITVSLLTMLLPRMSRAAADDDPRAVREDLSFGLRMSGVVIIPCAFAFLATVNTKRGLALRASICSHLTAERHIRVLLDEVLAVAGPQAGSAAFAASP